MVKKRITQSNQEKTSKIFNKWGQGINLEYFRNGTLEKNKLYRRGGDR